MEEQVGFQENKSAAFSPREFLLKNLKYLPWIILSTVICLVLAYLQLRYSTVIYEVQAKLLIKKESHSGGQNKLSDLFMANESQNLDDEIQIMKSTGISKRIVRKLGLQKMYFAQGNVKLYSLYPGDSPLILDILELKDSSQGFTFEIVPVNESSVTIDKAKTPVFLGQTFENSYGKFRFLKGPVNFSLYGKNIYNISWQPLESVAASIADGLTIAPMNDYSNVLLVRFPTENIKIGREIVNQLMEEYNIANVEDKRTITVYTLEFIDQRLDTIKRELGGVELGLQNYREQNKAIDLPQQSIISFNELSNATQTLAAQEVQIKILGWLTDYLDEQKNSNKTVPTSLGISEPSLQSLISQYNNAQLRRETQLRSTTPSNPIIRDLDSDIEKLRQQIRENLSNIRQSYIINRDNLVSKNQRAERDISAVPVKGRKLLEITREQKILEDLYSFLLQKKLETSISSASTISNSRVLEPAKALGIPMKPDRKGLYMLAIFLGLGIPLAILALKEYLNDKIQSRADIERLTHAPILGEVGHSLSGQTLVVTNNNRKLISEQFRIIRTNLQYILNKIERPVILVTSSYSGEGKSFISTNIGAVLALAGKKTVILEFDIRKPKIIAGLNLKGKTGITNYIVGDITVKDMIVPVKEVDNLFVIPCGLIPPNPAELLLNSRVKDLFDELRKEEYTVIVDSAPLGLVSDAFVLSSFVDATLYIMRQNYTIKKQLGLVDELYKKEKLPKISLVLNDVKGGNAYGGYYGNYGYGYSYGHGGDYFEDERKSKKGALNAVKNMFNSKGADKAK